MKKTSSPSRRIYMDNASLTPIDPEVLKEIMVFSGPEYGNPSSIHAEGVTAAKVVATARKRIADVIHGHADEMVFTASGTEANDLAIAGVIEAEVARGKKYSDLHVITSVIEHASILECVAAFEKKGVKVSRVGVSAAVGEEGIVDVMEIKKALRASTVLVSIQHVNNEIGTIQPIGEIAKMIRHARKTNAPHAAAFPYFHVDACQSPSHLAIDVRSFGVDMITFDGQKIYGPRGIGALWVKRGVKLEPIIRGGGQENGLRSGTENVASIAGFARAMELAEARRENDALALATLRDRFIEGLKTAIPEAVLNGAWVKGDFTKKRAAGNINFSLPERDTEFLLIQLDAKGIACSTKSSCLQDEDESYVIAALGRALEGDGTKNPAPAPARATHSLRFSLGRDTTKKDVDLVLAHLAALIKKNLASS